VTKRIPAASHTADNLAISLIPPNANSHLLNSFRQDEIVLIPDNLFLTVGSKLERGYHTSWNAPLSLVGQNLPKDYHEELVDFTGNKTTTRMKRSAYAKFTLQLGS